MGHNKIDHVLYEPELVGWNEGLKGVVSDARHFGVPLAVKCQEHMDQIKPMYPSLEIILVD